MDTATLVATLVGIVLGAPTLGGVGTLVVLIIRNRSERKINEMKATTENDSKLRADALAEWAAIHKRDEDEKEKIRALYQEQVDDLKNEVVELKAQVRELISREREYERNSARMEAQIVELTRMVEECRKTHQGKQ